MRCIVGMTAGPLREGRGRAAEPEVQNVACSVGTNRALHKS